MTAKKKNVKKKNLAAAAQAVTAELSAQPGTTALAVAAPAPTALAGAPVTGSVNLPITQEDLVNLQLSDYRKKCNQEIVAWGEVLMARKERADKLWAGMLASLNLYRDTLLQKLEGKFRADLLALGFAKLDLRVEISLPDRREPTGEVLATVVARSEGCSGGLRQDMTYSPNVITAKQAEELELADAETREAERNVTFWRKKLQDQATVREEALAAFTREKVRLTNGGNELVSRVSKAFSAEYLDDGPSALK